MRSVLEQLHIRRQKIREGLANHQAQSKMNKSIKKERSNEPTSTCEQVSVKEEELETTKSIGDTTPTSSRIDSAPIELLKQSRAGIACLELNAEVHRLRESMGAIEERTKVAQIELAKQLKGRLNQKLSTIRLPRNDQGHYRRAREILVVIEHRKIGGELRFRVVWEGIEWGTIWENLDNTLKGGKLALQDYLRTISSGQLQEIVNNRMRIGALIKNN